MGSDGHTNSQCGSTEAAWFESDSLIQLHKQQQKTDFFYFANVTLSPSKKNRNIFYETLKIFVLPFILKSIPP